MSRNNITTKKVPTNSQHIHVLFHFHLCKLVLKKPNEKKKPKEKERNKSRKNISINSSVYFMRMKNESVINHGAHKMHDSSIYKLNYTV